MLAPIAVMDLAAPKMITVFGIDAVDWSNMPNMSTTWQHRFIPCSYGHTLHSLSTCGL